MQLDVIKCHGSVCAISKVCPWHVVSEIGNVYVQRLLKPFTVGKSFWRGVQVTG